MLKSVASSLLLRGNVVLPDGSARDRYVQVRDGRIVSISRVRPPRTDDLPYVATRRSDWIFPGLIDLHTHSAYNLIPLWISDRAPFRNRFEWRGDDGYGTNVKRVKREITKSDALVVGVASELQAVAGGTAVLQESRPLDTDIGAKDGLLLCRDTASATDLGLDPKRRIYSVVDFFRPSDRDPRNGVPTPHNTIDRYVAARDAGKLVATIGHLSEGQSGFGSNRAVDPYSRREFEALMAHPAFSDPERVRSSPLTLVHGCGIDPHDETHTTFLRERGISVVWSPVSNLLLYGDTIDASAFVDAGVNLALGSDWSPSGSKHVWEEAQFARFYLKSIGATVSDAEIFRMVTTSAAACLGVPTIGRIQEGGLADFFILRSPLETDNALEVFFGTADRHVLATIIGGRPIYGDRKFMGQFTDDLRPLPRAEGSAVKNKRVHLPPNVKVDIAKDLAHLEAKWKKLDPPVWRSNLLVSADKIHRRRLQSLRADVERAGWSVQEWRHDGPANEPGLVKVHPSSVRVWRGFRAEGVTKEYLRKQLGSIFLSAAVQMQRPLGLSAYLPAVPPDDAPEGVPAEVALVFFESRKAYSDGFKTTSGRAFGLLHAPLFGRSSKSGWPKPLEGAMTVDQPYYLVDTPADWHEGAAWVFIGKRVATLSPAQFRKGVRAALRAVHPKAPRGLDGAIVSVNDDSVVYWEHWADASGAGTGITPDLADLAIPCLHKRAELAKVAPDIFRRSEGLPVAGGEFFNLQFERRALHPW